MQSSNATSSGRDFAGAQIPQPVTVYFDAQIDGSEVWLNLRAKAMVHGECAPLS